MVKNKMKIAVGVVGCGWFGRAHCRVFRSLENVELKAVADTRIEKAREIGEAYGCNYYSNSEEMYRKENLDAVSIVVTPQQLAIEGRKAVEAGVNVLLEKPLATRMEDYLELYREVSRKGVIFMPGFIELFNPAFTEVRKVLERQEIGEPLFLSSRRVGWNPKREVKWEVGCILDLGIHDLYIQTSLVGDIEEINGEAIWRSNDELEDIALITLKFKRGALGVIETNWLTPVGQRKLSITGSGGVVEADFVTQRVTIARKTGGLSETVRRHIRWDEPLRLELQHFVDSVRKGEKPCIDEEFGRKVLEQLFKVIAKCREKVGRK